jgi:hypothetical protein
MYNGKIGKYTFEFENNTKRIIVYEEGKGIDPVEYISVPENLTEKNFHYEIMDYTSKKG